MNLKAITAIRKSKKITLQEMANALGLKDKSTYYRIETGEVKMKAEHLPVIANKLGLTVDEITRVLFLGQEVA